MEIPWPTDPDEYEVQENLGIDASYLVQKAFCKSKDVYCAIRRMDLDSCAHSTEQLLKEIEETASSTLDHPNLHNVNATFIVKDELWMVFNLIVGGSLLDIINRRKALSVCDNGILNEETLATVLKDVLSGLEYLHKHNLIHLVIQASHILVDQDGTVFLAYYGLSAFVVNHRGLPRPNSSGKQRLLGSPHWMAPEVIGKNFGYDYKADIWGFGITAIELATGSAPHHNMSPMEVVLHILRDDPPNIHTNATHTKQYNWYGKTFRKMIGQCLQKDPKKRPDSTELLKHPFFTKAKDKRYLCQTLIAVGPSMEARIHKLKKHATKRCRLHRTIPGEWSWPDEAEDLLPSSSSQAPAVKLVKRVEKQTEVRRSRRTTSVDVTHKIIEVTSKEVYKSDNDHRDKRKVADIVLRIRNYLGELSEITFKFTFGKDSVEGVAMELVKAGLVNPRDSQEVSLNLDRLLDSVLHDSDEARILTFHLNSAGPNEKFDEKSLRGFAQISVDNT